MAERLKWNGEKKSYQPRIKSSRIHDLYAIKEVTHRPITVLVDEALAMYLSNALRSGISAQDEYIDRKIEEALERGPTNDDFEELSNYMS
jgi:hypothetical protein